MMERLGVASVETVDYTKKVLLVGDGAVGKTSLVRRYVHDLFSDRYIATIGTKTTRKELLLEYEEQGLKIKLDLGIWDILGQKGIEHAHQLYFKGAEGFIAVCDATRLETVASVPDWATRVRELCGQVPSVMAANKADLVADRQAAQDPLERAASSLNAKWWWTSAKTGENVEMLFYELGAILCEPIVAAELQARDGKAAPKKRRLGGGRRRGA